MAPFEYVDLDDENEEEEPSEPIDEGPIEPIDIRIVSSDILGPKDFIDIYTTNRNHIREQSKAVIPACGFLLTGAFGLLYFIFSSNNNHPINPAIVYFLVIVAIVLALAIVMCILSVQVSSSSQELPATRYQQQDILIDIYDKEYRRGLASIRLLGLALCIFIIIMVIFSYEYLFNTSLISNSSHITYITNCNVTLGL